MIVVVRLVYGESGAARRRVTGFINDTIHEEEICILALLSIFEEQGTTKSKVATKEAVFLISRYMQGLIWSCLSTWYMQIT